MKRTFSLLIILLAAASMQLRAAGKEIYAVFIKPKNICTLYYDEKRNVRSGVWDSWNAEEGTEHSLKADLSEVYTVVLDESMKDALPKVTSQWFANMTRLKSIEHLDYLNTEEVSMMYRMFYKCERLPFLDLSTFDVYYVRSMEEMLAGCSSLAVVDISSFVVPTNAEWVKIVKTTRMFADCTELRVIFSRNHSLYSQKEVGPWDSKEMFLNCNKLKGGNGTVYDSSRKSGIYGRPDMDGTPGYFTCVDESAKPKLYGLLNEEGTTLTIRFDTKLGPNRGIADWSMYNNEGANPNNNLYAVKKIVIDENVKDTLPESTAKWFYFYKFLIAIEHLDNLNTSNVTDMSNMFAYCMELPSLNLSSFNTGKVTNMSNMFHRCDGLTSVNVSSFNTENVTNMYMMFGECKKLSSLDLSGFNTENVTTMKQMFYQDLSLKNLDISSFKTPKVTNMSLMFKQCPVGSLDLNGFDTKNVIDMSGMFVFCGNLISLDITSFDFSNVVDISNMFYSALNLQTIYCNEDLSKAHKLENYENLFALCLNLTGGAGTAFDAEHTSDLSYARVDALGTPGYFTTTIEAAEPEIYGKLSSDGSTLTIRYDKKRPVVGGVSDWSMYNNAPANEKAGTNRITKVVIDETMKDAKPASTEGWFADYGYVKTIANLDMLNTSETTSMKDMFARCDSLIDLSVSGFDTKNVTDMSGMFSGCGRIRALDVSKFNTANVTDMSYMFNGCKRLMTIKVDNFDTRKVTDMSHMFTDCVYSSPLNIKNFDTRNVTDMSMMFSGLAYETSLNVSGFNTENVTDMSGMFSECKQLRSVDLRSFDIDKVTDLSAMFRNDSALIVLYANQDWSTGASLTVSDNMFFGCPKLKGGAGTAYSETHVDAAYARPDEGESQAGYFTAVAEIYATWDAETTTLTLRYDGNRENNGGTMEWALYSNLATKVVLDATMKQAEPTSTKDWFRSFVLLETIEHLDYLNTGDVTDMSYMFAGCSSLTTLNVNGFYVSWVQTAEGMFSYCPSLTTIWCDHNWNDNLYDKNTNNMFYGCTSLVGGKGTVYDANYTGSSRACTDSNLRYGYFTAMPTGGADLSGNELYAVLESDNKTLTIHYDKQRTSLGGSISWSKYSSNYSYNVTEVVFQPSVANAMPTSTEDWFRDFSDLENITGIEYLNTAYVTNMSGMFKDCSSLTTLDVSNFNTQNVTDMGFMFSDCSALTALDISRFDMRKVTIMYNMFENCESLTTLDIKEFDTREVTDMTMLFYKCKKLKALDVSKLNTAKVTDMTGMFAECEQVEELDVSGFELDNVQALTGMFYGCQSLTTIWCNDDWSKLPLLVYHENMFTDCPNLVGGGNTVYNSGNANDVTFAHVGSAGNPGYFTSNITCKVTLIAENGKIEVEEKDIDLEAVPKGTTLHLSAVPSDGFVLGSWTNYNGTSLIVNEDTEVTANFITQTFTVKFVDWDDTFIEQKIVDWGKGAEAPEAPVHEGYLFKGWSCDFSAVYSDMTVKAEYESEIVNYQVTLVAQDGKIEVEEDGIDLLAVPKGTILHLIATPDDGYTFDHWQNYDPELGLAVYEDITITAWFAPAMFTLKAEAYPTEGGTFKLGGVDENNQALYMSEYTIEAIPNEGYDFVEWRDGDEVLDNKTTKMSGSLYGDVVITGVFKKQTRTVTFLDHSGNIYKTESVEYGGSLDEPDGPEWEGHVFKGWDQSLTNITTDLTVKPLYDDQTYTVSFYGYHDADLGSVTVKHGGDVTPPVPPEVTGWHFKEWQGNYTNVTKDEKVYAVYEINTYQLTLTAEHGSVTIQETGIDVNAVEHGTTLHLIATPDEGYTFKQWSDGVKDNPRTVIVTENKTYTAEFEQIVIPMQKFTITVVSSDEKMGTVTGGGEYEENSVAEIRAIPAEGFKFTKWDDGNTDNPRKITVTANATYIASFEKEEVPAQKFTITVLSPDEKMGTVTGGGEYEENSVAEIRAIPAEGYTFTKWNDGNTDNPRSITVTADATYIANFEKLPDPVKEFTITVLSADESMGTVMGGGTYKEGSDIQIVAIPAEGCKFVLWNNGSIANPLTVVVTADATYIATFEKVEIVEEEFTITVLSADETKGTVEGGGKFKKGTTIFFGAVAKEGFRFTTWSDGVTDNPRSIVVEKDETFIANFEVFVPSKPTYTVTLIANPAEGGEVVGAGVYEEGETAIIAAQPAEGWEFIGWSDGNTDLIRQIVIEHDLTLVANFQEISEGLDAVSSQQSAVSPRKVLIEGHVYIMLPDGTMYDAGGQRICAIENK